FACENTASASDLLAAYVLSGGSFVLFYVYIDLFDLHSFPTRRSSDLYEPHYISIRGKGDVIKELRKEAKKASHVYLAADPDREGDRKSTRLNSSHVSISYAVFCLKEKKGDD